MASTRARSGEEERGRVRDDSVATTVATSCACAYPRATGRAAARWERDVATFPQSVAPQNQSCIFVDASE